MAKTQEMETKVTKRATIAHGMKNKSRPKHTNMAWGTQAHGIWHKAYRIYKQGNKHTEA